MNDQPIPVFFISKEQSQINAQLPYEIDPGTASAVLTKGNVTTAPFTFNVQPSAPGIIMYGNKRAVAIHTDNSLNADANGAGKGSILTVYMLDIGRTTPAVGTNASAPFDPLAVPAISPWTAKIGDKPATVHFLGLTPGSIGLAQVNVEVPDLAPGNYDLVVTIGDYISNAATITVK